MTVNPDLVFDHGTAIGDVKYKIFSEDWSRSNLYQNVAFAAAFSIPSGCLIGFRNDEAGPIPPRIVIGNIQVTSITWRATASTPPEAAADAVAHEVSDWLENPLSQFEARDAVRIH